eukprot:m.84891 g.84891  ORF g.84891 m.84891 type:complete len:72 (+) comp8221_c0_seq1:70-285(+)
MSWAVLESTSADVAGYIIIGPDSSMEVMTDRSFSISTAKRTYFLYADGVAPAKEWIQVLEAAIKKVHGSSA